MQAKAYARANGIPTLKNEMDRSTVTYQNIINDSDVCVDTSNMIVGLLVSTDSSYIHIICIFHLSNLLLLSLTILYFRKMFLWLQQQGKQTKILYKASAIVLTCVNIILLTSDIAFIISDLLHFGQIISLLIFGKVPLVILILILETAVICFNTRELDQNNGMTMNKKRYRIAHAFALCQIIWFMHRLVNDAIISIIFFIIAPAQTLGIITFLLFVIASTIAFVAIILHKGLKRKTCLFLFCVALNGIIICGLLFVITLLYIVFVDNGLKSAEIGGFILSLVPPLAVFVIGFIVNRKYYNYFRSNTSTALVDVTTDLEQQGTNENTTVQIDDDSDSEPDRSHDQQRLLMRSRCTIQQ